MKYPLILLVSMLISSSVFGQQWADAFGNNATNEYRIPSERAACGSIKANSFDLVHVIPSPISYPNTAAFDGTDLWVTGQGEYQIFKISMVDGSKLDSIPISFDEPYGMAWDGQSFWVTDAGPDSLYRIDVNGNVLTSLKLPAQAPSHNAGLAFDGTNIWLNDPREPYTATPGDSTYVVTTNGTLVAQYEAIGDLPSGLTYDGTFLWSINTALDEIHKVHPSTFFVFETYLSPGPLSIGLTFDGQHLWVVDNGADSLYQVEIGKLSTSIPNSGNDEVVNIYPNPSTDALNIDLDQGANNIEVSIRDIQGRMVWRSFYAQREHIMIDPESIGKGVYLIEVQSDEHSSTHKVVLE